MFEAPVNLSDENLHGRKVFVLLFNSQKYNRKAIWLTISQAEELPGPLRAVSQKQEQELMESLQSKR